MAETLRRSARTAARAPESTATAPEPRTTRSQAAGASTSKPSGTRTQAAGASTSKQSGKKSSNSRNNDSNVLPAQKTRRAPPVRKDKKTAQKRRKDAQVPNADEPEGDAELMATQPAPQFKDGEATENVPEEPQVEFGDETQRTQAAAIDVDVQGAETARNVVEDVDMLDVQPEPNVGRLQDCEDDQITPADVDMFDAQPEQNADMQQENKADQSAPIEADLLDLQPVQNVDVEKNDVNDKTTAPLDLQRDDIDNEGDDDTQNSEAGGIADDGRQRSVTPYVDEENDVVHPRSSPGPEEFKDNHKLATEEDATMGVPPRPFAPLFPSDTEQGAELEQSDDEEESGTDLKGVTGDDINANCNGADDSRPDREKPKETNKHWLRLRGALDRLRQSAQGPVVPVPAPAGPVRLDLSKLMRDRERQAALLKKQSPTKVGPEPLSSPPPSSPCPPGNASPVSPPSPPPLRRSSSAPRSLSPPSLPARNWEERHAQYRAKQQRGPGEHLGLQPSETDRVLRPRGGPTLALAPGSEQEITRAPSEDSDDESDFSATEAEARAKMGKEAPDLVDYEVQDDQDFDAMIEENARVTRSKGKGKAKATDDGADDTSAELVGRPSTSKTASKASGSRKSVTPSVNRAAPSSSEEDSDEEDTGDDTVAWELTPGPLGKEDLEKAQAARRLYHGTMLEIARDAKKRPSAVFKAVGDHETRGRKHNPWNAFQLKYRMEHPKGKDVSATEYNRECKAAYDALFDELPEEERNDKAARKTITDPLLSWYAEKSAVVVDARKANGHGPALINKAVQPFIHQSTVAHQTHDIDVFGFAVDSFGDQAVIWGGSPDFFAVHKTYKGAIKQKLNDMKAMIQVIRMARRDAEANAETQPIVIDFSNHEKEKKQRDVFRRTIPQLFLNQIHLVFRAREEDAPSATNFSWKWAEFAVQHRMRIVNWPTTIKHSHPGPGFALKSLKKEEQNAWYEMWRNLMARYKGEGEDDGTGVAIESWTEEEMEYEGTDLARVPIIEASDGAILMRASKSGKHMRRLGIEIDDEDKEGEDVQKDAVPEDADEEDEDEDLAPVASNRAPTGPQKRRRSVHFDDEEEEEPPEPAARSHSHSHRPVAPSASSPPASTTAKPQPRPANKRAAAEEDRPAKRQALADASTDRPTRGKAPMAAPKASSSRATTASKPKASSAPKVSGSGSSRAAAKPAVAPTGLQSGAHATKLKAAVAPKASGSSRAVEKPAAAPAASPTSAQDAPRRLVKCAYMRKGVRSTWFEVHDWETYEGEPTDLDLHMVTWSDVNGKWSSLPPGVRPLLNERQAAQAKFFRMTELGMIE